MSDIIVKGAREHNLQNVDLVLPRNKLICFTGVSGSGKSSLAFDTLYAEGQRRYVESLSSYARQFLGQLPKPDVDQITGLSPAISISQKTGGQNTRSTVGTITEIYDFLRVLFARVATGYCPHCGKPITAQTRQQIIDQIKWTVDSGQWKVESAHIPLLILAPVIRGQKGEFKDLFSDLLRQGYNRARVDGTVVRLADDLKLDRQMRHDIEVVIDRIDAGGQWAEINDRVAEAVERALAVGEGNLVVCGDVEKNAESEEKNVIKKNKRNKKQDESVDHSPQSAARSSLTFSAKYACADCGISFEPPSPQLFSFNTPRGMCPHCDGLGEIHSFAPDLLIPDPTKSFQQGCIEPIGKWRDMGRWRRHIFHGVAETLEKMYELPPNTILETAWEELDPKIQKAILWGTGDKHITFTWRNGSSGHKWGGAYEGIIPKMLSQYRESKSRMQRLAMEKYMQVLPCGYCNGERLNEQARAFRIETSSSQWEAGSGKNEATAALTLPQLCNLPINRLQQFFTGLQLSEAGQKIAAEALKEIRNRLGFLVNVGLEYLTLGRTAPTLSGGEMQRIRLASQIGSGLVGVLYILDEPSIGLHPRDNDRLLATLAKLRDLGNTVIVVEHDEDTMRAADVLIDFGPGPGVHGGYAQKLALDSCQLPVVSCQFLFTANNHCLCNYEHFKIVSELDSLTEINHLDPQDILLYAALSKGGNVWNDFADAESGSVHSEQHRRRTRTRIEQGVYPISDDCKGLFVRIRDTADCRKGDRLSDDGNIATLVNRLRRNRKIAQWLNEFLEINDILPLTCRLMPETSEQKTGNWQLTTGNSNSKSLTLQYLTGEASIPLPKERRAVNPDRKIAILGAAHNNLKKIDVEIPLGMFVCVTGVSGSGKSSLINDILVEALNRDLNRGIGSPGTHRKITGIELLDKMIDIDQSPIGRGSHSNPATYIKLFDEIRNLFAELPEAKVKGYLPGRFSFNVKGGRCETCEGRGTQKLEMDFLADIYITCPVCQGARFNYETLSVQYKGKSITDVLNMDVEEALQHFENHPKINHYLTMLNSVGLGYMKLGQPSPTLSGGEAQRIKLARELVKRSTGKTLYLLDEPTTGLHFADIKMLLGVLHQFADEGNTVLVVEHNLDVIKTADWIIDLGPEGGEKGGYIIAAGTPEELAENEKSYTGKSLRKVLGKDKTESAAIKRTKSTSKTEPESAHAITIRGATEHNLKNVSVNIPRDKMTICSGPSGSGKSSLAMDTVYAEGQRRYVESLSSYARQFIGQLQKPHIEHIEGLSPAIAIEQKAASHSPRSTVGTITEIQDYLRVLFARLGTPHCPQCGIPVSTQTLDEIVEKIANSPILTTDHRSSTAKLMITAPFHVEVGQIYDDLWKRLRADGFHRVRIDGVTYSLEEPPEIDRRRKHDVELIIDRIQMSGKADAEQRARVAESVETALSLGNGIVHVIEADEHLPEAKWHRIIHSQHLSCGKCGRSFEMLTPHHFSANSPLGWCPNCEGLGVQWGTNPALFLNDPQLTLAEGAVQMFPDPKSKLGKAMLSALAKQTGIPLDIPFDQLDGRHRRIIFHGTGNDWHRTEGALPFEFQYKGLYPAMEEAMRLVPALRMQNEELIGEVECGACMGSRLRDDASAVRFMDQTIDQIGRMPLGNLLTFFGNLTLQERERKIAGDLLTEIKNRLQFLVDVGLEYLTLSRPAPSLSGGETQRIRLAAQIGSGLVGVLYVLDEPTIGLHPRDNHRLTAALHKLRDLGNTLLVVEHDRDVISSADHVLDFGPKAGVYGGEIVAQGTPAAIGKQRSSVTGRYLSGKKTIPIPVNRRVSPEQAKTCPVRN